MSFSLSTRNSHFSHHTHIFSFPSHLVSSPPPLPTHSTSHSRLFLGLSPQWHGLPRWRRPQIQVCDGGGHETKTKVRD
ncbi:hypothetical protein Sjap_012713 [Stephania japonica]|uniref:Uncharacterized protein n=1 Tax=Stephania japonica TaxID=461633 RepID=A0AAP0IWK2_9MAGN